MKDRLLLFLYITFIMFFTSIHNIYVLFIFSILLLFLSGKDIFEILKKSLLSIFIFNSIVSISYIVFSLWKNQPWVDYVLLLNLRVFNITFLTFLFISKVNIFKAVSFSKTLQYLLVLSYSQILIYKRYFQDFSFALKSRTIEKPRKKDIYNFISRVFLFFFNKSIQNSKEITQAMKSRGFFIE